MRFDIVTIFPSFFEVLDISLLGKARTNGLLEYSIHDLRDFTADKHHTVDDTPYGGGAGMVMKPEPWGEDGWHGGWPGEWSGGWGWPAPEPEPSGKSRPTQSRAPD